LVSLSCSVRVQSGHGSSGLSQEELDAIRRYAEEFEFVRLAGIERREGGHWTGMCWQWIKENESAFSDYLPVVEELAGIEETRMVYLERSLNLRIGLKGTSDLEKIECFARLAPVNSSGRAASSAPEEISAVLRRFRADGRRDHLPYLLEYGLNLHLKHVKTSKLARVLPIDENLMVAELVRLTEIPKYKTAHEAGWLDRQFVGGFEKSSMTTGYSSYQIYLWYLENWSDVMAMPNSNRLVHIQKQIEQTGMHGVGGGLVCHYGCH